MEMNNWEYEFGDQVKLQLSQEQGIVVGRAEHQSIPDQYLIRYVTGAGCQVEAWMITDCFQRVE